MAKQIAFDESARRSLEARVENLGAQLVKSVATKTNDIAGDGTTTATVLAQALVKAGLRNVAAGANPMSLKRGIDKAVAVAVEESNTFGIELDFTEGMLFDKGYLSPYFVTDAERQESVLENPYILFNGGKISSV